MSEQDPELHRAEFSQVTPVEIGEPWRNYREVAEFMAVNTQKDRAMEQLQLAYDHLLERLLDLRQDTLVERAFTPEGLKDELAHNEELRAELQQGNWGVLRLDVRFVFWMNLWGNLVGDRHIESGGDEIATAVDGIGLARLDNRRHRHQPVEVDRRQGEERRGHSRGGDIICRQGGDEFSIIFRNLSTDDLVSAAARTQDRFTVSHAITNYNEGRVPFIASVGFRHASQVRQQIHFDLINGDLWSAFRKVNSEADDFQRAVKKRQYEEMWGLTARHLPENAELINQPEDRKVAELFLEHLCPDFHRNPFEFFSGGLDSQSDS